VSVVAREEGVGALWKGLEPGECPLRAAPLLSLRLSAGLWISRTPATALAQGCTDSACSADCALVSTTP